MFLHSHPRSGPKEGWCPDPARGWAEQNSRRSLLPGEKKLFSLFYPDSTMRHLLPDQFDHPQGIKYVEYLPAGMSVPLLWMPDL